MKHALWLASALACVASASVSQAASTTLTFNIAVTGLLHPPGTSATAPVDPFDLSMEVDYDTALDTATTTSGLTIGINNSPYTVRFAYDASSDFMTIGDYAVVGGCTFHLQSFCLAISDASTGSPTAEMTQVGDNQQDFWTGPIVFGPLPPGPPPVLPPDPPPPPPPTKPWHLDLAYPPWFIDLPPEPALPEPASWAMMLSGMMLVGGALRRNRAPRHPAKSGGTRA